MGKIEWWVECVSAARMRGPCSINMSVSLGCPDRMMRRMADRAVELSTIIGWLVRVAPNMSDKRAIVTFASVALQIRVQRSDGKAFHQLAVPERKIQGSGWGGQIPTHGELLQKVRILHPLA